MKTLKKIGIFKWIIGAVLLLVLGFFGFTAEVREGETAIITRFGEARAEVTEAGLYFKLPWPFEQVTKYDARKQYSESEFLEVQTRDSRSIILQSYAVWHIDEPLKYHNALGDKEVAKERINGLIYDASYRVMGQFDMENILSNDPDKLQLEQIEETIFLAVNAQMQQQYGVAVENIGIMKLSLPEDNLNAAFEQMSADRQKHIDKIIAEGQKEASAITYQAEKDASAIIAEGTKEAAKIDAETEKLVAQIYAEAQAENKDLFKFLLELDTVLNSVNGETTLIVKKGEFMEGLFSEELLQMVKDAQNADSALDAPTPEPEPGA